MDVMDVLSYAGDTATQNVGNIEKAIIEIIDLRDRDTVYQDAIKIAEGGGALGGLGGGLGGKVNAGMNTGLIGNVVSALMGNNPPRDDIAEIYFQKLATKKRLFTVQFNPSTLRLSGHSGTIASTLDHIVKSNNEVNYKAVDASISLSVELLFDSMDPKDAFMSDKLDASPTGFLTGMADLGMTAGKKKKKTVQREVEGFIAALRNENTRLITFHWGEICYSGVLRRVGVEYTMFNVTGEPVRASVGLTIMCADAGEWPNSLAVWQERYKESFKDGSESFVRTSQKAGNLLNF